MNVFVIWSRYLFRTSDKLFQTLNRDFLVCVWDFHSPRWVIFPVGTMWTHSRVRDSKANFGKCSACHFLFFKLKSLPFPFFRSSRRIHNNPHHRHPSTRSQQCFVAVFQWVLIPFMSCLSQHALILYCLLLLRDSYQKVANRTAVIVSYARTPIGRISGALASKKATELGAVAVRAAVERAGITGDQVQEVNLLHSCSFISFFLFFSFLFLYWHFNDLFRRSLMSYRLSLVM